MANKRSPDYQQEPSKPWDPNPPKAKKQRTRSDAPSVKDKSKPYNRRGEDPNYVPPTPETRRKQNAPICGAPRSGRSDSGPGTCCQTAGWGTSHPGVGHCKFHGGNMPSHVAAAEKEMATRAVATFGLPVDIDPHQALRQELARTNGHVLYLGNLIAELDSPDKLKQYTDAGVSPSVWVQMYETERAHMVKVATEAIKCGVAEREIQLAEEQGRLVAMVLQAFIRDPELGLTPKQLAFAPKILRKHILAAPDALEAATTEGQEVIIDV